MNWAFPKKEKEEKTKGAMLKCAPPLVYGPCGPNAGLWACGVPIGVYGVPRDGRSLWRAYRAKMLCCKFKPYATQTDGHGERAYKPAHVPKQV